MFQRSSLCVAAGFAAVVLASPPAAGQTTETGNDGMAIVPMESTPLPVGEIQPVVDAPPTAEEVSNIPGGVRAMINAAMKTNDKGKIETVLALARQAAPHGEEEVKAIQTAWR